jgi:hypothetical protein
MRRIPFLIVCLAALTAGFTSSARCEVHVALLPADAQVEPYEVFNLQLVVTEAGSAFNAYDITIEFDPSLITFVPRPQSEQEGELMTGACANRIQWFDENNGVITLTYSLLCPGVSVTGPGVLYELQFVAGATPVVTEVHVADVRFANAGILVGPAYPADALVHIGAVTGMPSDGPGVTRSVLHPPFPNPFQSSVQIAFTPGRSGLVRIDVVSVSGRVVQRLTGGEMQAGASRTFTWNGRDEAGLPVAAGVYWVRVLAPDGPFSTRLVKIR